MKLVDVRCGSAAVHEQGSGPALVLLHANPGDHRDYDAVVPALARRYHTIGVDWPGYGESPPPDPPRNANAMLLADVLEDVVDSLHLTEATFVGNSVGGFAAARLAIRRPEQVRGLVLVDPGGFTSHNLFTRGFCRIKGSERVTKIIAGRFASWYMKKRTPQVQEIISRTDAGRRLPATVAVDAAIWRSFLRPEHDLRALAAQISVPVLLVWGKRDPVIPVSKDGRNAVRSIPDARLVVLDTGHEPFAEDPDAFLAAVLPFLEEVSGENRRAPSHG